MIGTLLLAAALAQAPEAAAPPSFAPDPSWKSLGKDLWFDPKGKRLILRAKVCLREGYLEHLLCITRSKEHESILSTDAPPRMIHAGLLLTGAEPGQTVQFVPEFQPPKGTPIAVKVEWIGADGQPQSADAREWVKDQEKPRHLSAHWVFAGSMTDKDPETQETRYAADGGDLITVSNFMSAILDVPFASSASDTERSFVADTARIPPLDTPVTLILEPIAEPATPKAGP